MLNLNIDDIGNTIGTLIFFFIIVIGLLIIIDEIFNLSKFCYKYTYLYNYGKLNENVCNKNLIEFEKARFRVHNEINKYKMEKDLFNKNWINYVVFISILLMSIIMSLAFGYIYYHLFINDNLDCNIEVEKSFINKILECTNSGFYLPNCTINYLILFIIIIIYPLIFLSKYLINTDYSLDSNGKYTKLFHLLVLISLLYFVYILFNSKKYDDIGLFVSFIIVFYVINITYNKAFDDYYNINKGTNIYSRDKTLVGILNKYFHFADNYDNTNDFRDINFFEIYKQQEPTKPKFIQKPDELEGFKYCKDEDFTDEKNKYCFQFDTTAKRDNYKLIKDKINEYYKNKKQYEKDINTYNLKYNIYKNNKIEFPEFVSIITHMLPKLLGVDKTTHIIVFICLLIFLFYYNYLKTNDKKDGANFLFNTIITYIICLLSILILSNSVLTYNTYVNKYLIYEPIAFYKEDLFNMDVLFNILLNKDTDKGISNNYIYLYNKISSKKLSVFNSNTTPTSLDENIKKIEKGISITSPDINKPTDEGLINFRKQILRVLYSDLLKINSLFETNIIHDYKGDIGNSIYNTSLIAYNKGGYDKELRTFFLIIKKIFVEDKRDFDKHIQKIKNNFKNIIYGDINNITLTVPNSDTQFYNTYLIKDFTAENIDNTKNNEYTNLYLNNLNYINMIFDYYKEFLKEFRDLIIELFNSTEVICENKNNVININTKLNHYFTKIFSNPQDFNNDYSFNYTFKNEPKINVYKQVLKIKIDELNIKFNKYFNIIKTILFQGFDTSDTSSSNKLEYNIINNYNYFNKDTTKHLSHHLLQYFVNINSDDKNKYDNYDSEKLLKLNLSINNIGWSFVILIIIIAIFLIETIIIQS